MARSRQKKNYIRPLTLIIFCVMVVLIIVLQVISHYQQKEKNTLSPEEYTQQMNQDLEEYINQILPKNEDSLSLIPESQLPEEELLSKEIGFIARDSQAVRARLSKPAGAGPFAVLIIAHSGQSSERSTDRTAEVLGERLMNELHVVTVTVDWRESEFGQGDLTDVVSAVDWVKTLPETKDQPIVLFGMDHGAYLSVLALEDVSVDGIVDAYGYVNPAEQYHFLLQKDTEAAHNFVEQSGCVTVVDVDSCLQQLSVLDTIDINIPLLVLHSFTDATVPIAQTESLIAGVKESLVTNPPITGDEGEHDFFSAKTSPAFEQGITALKEWMENSIVSADDQDASESTDNKNSEDSPTNEGEKDSQSIDQEKEAERSNT